MAKTRQRGVHMFDGLGILSLFLAAKQIIKEKRTPYIPAENWGNMKLMCEDTLNGMKIEEQMKHLENGRYILPPEAKKSDEPDLNEVYRAMKAGELRIENGEQFQEDCINHGAIYAYTLAYKGKYINSNHVEE